ncbi:MAG TPA: RagB/SusD family nutrient uptake outer membrane protein [Bacteroidales bacterium]|nr:RagB/SusD family nutrient uptake outer membrane protein [Bacteroidales bacterium]
MNKILIFLHGVFLIALLGSCSDLDLDPTDRFSDAAVWKSKTTLDSYVTGFYAHMRDNSQLYANDLTDCYSDILKSTSWDQYNHYYNKVLLQGEYIKSADAGSLDKWGNYVRIKRQNEFLRDALDKGSQLGEDFIKIRIAEVRFIRAFAYFQMARVYGGVVIRDEIGGLDSRDEKDKARATEAETWDFILNDLKLAAEDLPEKWDSEWTGRATKAAAFGLLSRCALYAKKWDVAIEAAKNTKKTGGDLLTSYADVFTTPVESNKEVLFAVSFSDPVLHQFDRNYRPSGDVDTYSEAVPTSELVDSYEMADGTPFSWSTFGNDPYVGREPRFYASILYNGAPWEGRTIESFVGGKDGFQEWKPAGAITSTVTGYYMRKYLQEGRKYLINQSDQPDIIIRYAEVLLNLAEALAEQDFASNETQALAALNEVRNRVSLPGIKADQVSDKESFMSFVRHERMIELAFEGFRYWDLRRWRLAESVINNKTAHGVKITKNTDGSFTYDQIDCDGGLTRYFDSKYYLMSIPESERLNNTLIGPNNPGW